jgi:hypothetical protein
MALELSFHGFKPTYRIQKPKSGLKRLRRMPRKPFRILDRKRDSVDRHLRLVCYFELDRRRPQVRI